MVSVAVPCCGFVVSAKVTGLPSGSVAASCIAARVSSLIATGAAANKGARLAGGAGGGASSPPPPPPQPVTNTSTQRATTCVAGLN